MILTFFYKQAVYEFRINQLEWTQQDKLKSLFIEKVPIVIRGLPSTAFWTHEDVLLRDAYSSVPIFEDKALGDWLVSTAPIAHCPWDYDHARILGEASNLDIWTERYMNPSVHANPIMSMWLRPECSCWAGERGLWKSKAAWTCIFATEGTVNVTIMPGNVESALPKKWQGLFPGSITVHDTPFVADLKFMDIILRPGNCIIMPAHWFISWNSVEENQKCPMVCMVEYHTPISRFARWVKER